MGRPRPGPRVSLIVLSYPLVNPSTMPALFLSASPRRSGRPVRFLTPLSSMRARAGSVVNVPTTLTQDDTCRCSTTVLRVGGTHKTRAASPSVR